MLRNLATAILLSIITAISCFAEVNTYRIKIGDFTHLKVVNNINVVYRCNPDSAGYAVYDADRTFANAYIFSNNKGTLKIELATEHSGKDSLPTLTVYSEYLNSIESSSEKTVLIDTPLPCPLFKTKLIGNGKIIIDNLKATTAEIQLSTGNGTIVTNGNVNTAKIKTIGTGTIQADELIAKEVICTILGTGSIGCYPTELLQTKGIGTTKIYYKGNPIIKKSGGGNIIQLK